MRMQMFIIATVLLVGATAAVADSDANGLQKKDVVPQHGAG